MNLVSADPTAINLLAEEEEKLKQHKAAVKIQSRLMNLHFPLRVRSLSRYRGYVVRKAYKVYKLGGSVSELLYSPATYGFDLSVLNAPKPQIGRASCRERV